jgi:hypothetical protein
MSMSSALIVYRFAFMHNNKNNFQKAKPTIGVNFYDTRKVLLDKKDTATKLSLSKVIIRKQLKSFELVC